ncbi:MAG: c-type cytochrome, partial [Gammaproteobacteria bacterium]
MRTMRTTPFGHLVPNPRVCAQALAVAALLVLASSSAAWAQQPAAVTFAKDIAPIFQKNCQNCHQSGAIGPMSLTTFEEVRPWARAIKQKVVAGEMPPYRYDRDVGIQKLKNDLRL